MSGSSFVLLIACLTAGDRPPEPGALPEPPEALRAGFQSIQEADLRAWVGFLASPELGGRETGRPGYDTAARFCATLFERYGLKPMGGGGSYFQEFEVIRTEPDLEASSLEVEDSSGRERFGLSGNLALARAEDVDWTVRWVFAGYGEGADRDAQDDFSRLPLEDRVVMVLPRPGRTEFESRGAAAAGARRIAVISDERVKQKIGLRSQERPGYETPGKRSSAPEIVYLTRKVADRLLHARGATVDSLLAGRPARLPRFELEGVQVRVSLKRKSTTVTARNVLGLLPGSDSSLAEEVVAVGAHLDHVGIHDGKVFPGADDDASGSSGILALVKAFAESPRRPARSVLFMLFAGEEKGLWGSRYFVDHPTVPLARIQSELQMDMIGRNEEHPPKEKAEDNLNSVHLVGADRGSRDLRRTILDVNRYVGLDFEYDEEDVYGRSDQINFGDKGIPVTFFFTGFHRDYHQPTDTPDKINYPKMARVLRLVFASVFELGERREPLRRLRRT